MEKAQTPIVVAQNQRSASILRKLAHEAEHAGISTGADAIEDGSVESDSPALPLFALEHDRAAVAFSVDVGKLHFVFRGIPLPIQDVAKNMAVHLGDEASGRKARIVGGRALFDLEDACDRTSGVARIFMNRFRCHGPPYRHCGAIEKTAPTGRLELHVCTSLPAEVCRGINSGPRHAIRGIDVDLEVQVSARGKSGVAGNHNLLACGDLLPHADKQLASVEHTDGRCRCRG